MRITEIADAVEQLALWKLINTSVWTALDTQARQQSQQRAASQQQRKAKPSRIKSRAKSRSVAMPHVPKAPKQPKQLPKPKHIQKTANPSTQQTQPTQKYTHPHTQQAQPTRYPSLTTINPNTHPPTSQPATQATQVNPSSSQQPHATQASHTLTPQSPTALPLQKRLSAQKKRV
jgi:hypothetical protein